MSYCSPTSFACLLVLALNARATPPDSSPPLVFQEVLVLEDGPLRVSLKVAEQASIADEKWISLVFKNSGDEPIEIRNARYHIDSRRHSPATGVVISSGGMGQGNDFNFFPEAWNTTPVSPRLVPPTDVHVVDEHLSDYAAALLRMPPPGGLDVRATIHMHFDMADGAQVATPDSGVEFQFLWQYPTEEGFAAMRERLSRLLAHERESRPTDAYMLGVLLELPDVGGQITCKDIIDAIVLRGGNTWDRNTLVRRLAKHCNEDDAVVTYYVRQIERRDYHAISDLYGSNLYHSAFTEPLIATLNSSGIGASRALIVLHQHRDLWRNDPVRLEQVFNAVKPHESLGFADPGTLTEHRIPYWQSSVRRLAMTGHRSLISHFAGNLDNRQLMPGVSFPFDSIGRPIPLRVCDVAMQAILTVLDGDPYEAYHRAGLRHADRKDVEGLLNLYDQMIDELKQRLRELDHERDQ